MQSYYVTTPIYYVNDKPHIGHAYTSLACDVLARFKRLDGYTTYFLTGTDEHGQKVEKSAHAHGVSPQDFTDRVSQNFRDLLCIMNISNDDFIRTTEPRHRRACQALWQRLLDKGHIYLDSYAGWYAIRDEAYYAEDELIDKDGIKYAPTGAEVEWVEEASYFFDLSKWQHKLLDLYAKNPDFIAPKSRRNEVLNFVKSGLHDLSISRTTFKWGVAVPNDHTHIMYVWLDALTNYITALGYPDEHAEKYQTFWGNAVHVVGKDIIRFHTVYWPALLMAAELPLPKRIFAHGWWTNEGQKISKSVGNVIDPIALVREYGRDQTRYFMMREVPFGNDGDFRKTAIVCRINADLANDMGNFCQRSLSMIHKNCAGILPTPDLYTQDTDLIQRAKSVIDEVRPYMDTQQFHKALESIWGVLADANRYIDVHAPWTLKNTDTQRMGTVLYTCAEVVRIVGILIQPFMPDAADKILDLVQVKENRRFADIGTSLVGGAVLPKPQAVFPRIIDAE